MFGNFNSDRQRKTKEELRAFYQKQIFEKQKREEEEKLQSLRSDLEYLNFQEEHSPWGRGGGGAPLLDSRGDVIADLHEVFYKVRTPKYLPLSPTKNRKTNDMSGATQKGLNELDEVGKLWKLRNALLQKAKEIGSCQLTVGELRSKALAYSFDVETVDSISRALGDSSTTYNVDDFVDVLRHVKCPDVPELPAIADEFASSLSQSPSAKSLANSSVVSAESDLPSHKQKIPVKAVRFHGGIDSSVSARESPLVKSAKMSIFSSDHHMNESPKQSSPVFMSSLNNMWGPSPQEMKIMERKRDKLVYDLDNQVKEREAREAKEKAQKLSDEIEIIRLCISSGTDEWGRKVPPGSPQAKSQIYSLAKTIEEKMKCEAVANGLIPDVSRARIEDELMSVLNKIKRSELAEYASRGKDVEKRHHQNTKVRNSGQVGKNMPFMGALALMNGPNMAERQKIENRKEQLRNDLQSQVREKEIRKARQELDTLRGELQSMEKRVRENRNMWGMKIEEGSVESMKMKENLSKMRKKTNNAQRTLRNLQSQTSGEGAHVNADNNGVHISPRVMDDSPLTVFHNDVDPVSRAHFASSNLKDAGAGNDDIRDMLDNLKDMCQTLYVGQQRLQEKIAEVSPTSVSKKVKKRTRNRITKKENRNRKQNWNARDRKIEHKTPSVHRSETGLMRGTASSNRRVMERRRRHEDQIFYRKM
eukprot:g3671.t1